LQFQPLKTLAKAEFSPDGEKCRLFSTLSDAINEIPLLAMES